MGVGAEHQVAAGGVQHALRFAGGTGGVEDEQRVFRVHALGLAGVGLAVDDGVEPAVARHLHVDRAAGVAHHQHGFDGVGAGHLQRRVDVGLKRHGLAAAQALRSEEHTSELQSLMRISYAVFCLKKKKNKAEIHHHTYSTTTAHIHESYK